MEERLNGEWIKYNKEPGNWKYDNRETSSYYRLYQDVKNSDTKWPITHLDKCMDDLCGEMIPSTGEIEGDIYVYYEINAQTRKPLMYIKARPSVLSDDDGLFIEAFGTSLPIDNEKYINYNVDANLLPILIAKLKEIGARTRDIKEFQDKEESYNTLLRIKEKGIQTEDDILTLYSSFYRRDTNLGYELMAGRNILEDYNSLGSKNKEKLILCLCKMNSDLQYDMPSLLPLSRLKKINGKEEADKLLEVSDREVLVNVAAETKLKCLIFASEELLEDKNFIIEAASTLRLFGVSLFERYIPKKFKTDIDVLQVATKSDPSELVHTISSYFYPNSEVSSEIEELLTNSSYVKRLADAYFRNILAHHKYVEERFTNPGILWYFSVNLLDNIENNILWGPEPTPEREEMRQKIYSDIITTRGEIKEYIRKREKNNK